MLLITASDWPSKAWRSRVMVKRIWNITVMGSLWPLPFDTVHHDADGIYHPALFNDRLLLGLKGHMSEAELHMLRAPASTAASQQGSNAVNSAEDCRVGFVWGEADGEVRFHPDEAIVTAVRNVFARFAETGSARRVWLWFRSEGLTFMHQNAEIRWVEASYTAIHHVLTNPVYGRRLRLWPNHAGRRC